MNHRSTQIRTQQQGQNSKQAKLGRLSLKHIAALCLFGFLLGACDILGAGEPVTISSFGVSSDNMTANLSASITGSANQVVIYWGDGQNETVTGDFSSITKSHEYSTNGNYTISLQAKNAAGAVAASSQQIVSIKRELEVIRIESFNLTTTEDTASLNASISGAATEVTINWGDGQTDTINMNVATISATHQYAADDSYTVILTATGGENTLEDSQQQGIMIATTPYFN